MKQRIVVLLTVVALLVAMMLVMAAPAIAQGNGPPPGGPCGVFSGFGVGEEHPINVEPAVPGIFFDCAPTGRPS